MCAIKKTTAIYRLKRRFKEANVKFNEYSNYRLFEEKHIDRNKVAKKKQRVKNLHAIIEHLKSC